MHFNTDGYSLLIEKAAQLATQDFNLDPKTYGAVSRSSGDRRHVGQLRQRVLLGGGIELDLRQPPCR